MSTHNICFHGEIRHYINIVLLKKNLSSCLHKLMFTDPVEIMCTG